MGVKPAQGELNNALQPIFAHIQGAHLIHDDLIIATKTDKEHTKVIEEVVVAISEAGLTLNPLKCKFGKKEVSFWGMIYDADGVRPDPEKVEALKYITAPKSKEDLISFLCMMQSNSDFIENFSKKSASLRELTKTNKRFKWMTEHQECFENIIKEFKKDALLRYFNLEEPIFIFTDAHVTGVGAMLAQGKDMKSAKPIAFASRTTSSGEARYPQLDLEALAVDFGLRRFRHYLVGAPYTINVITDHKPLCSIFNGNRKGSIRTEQIKMRHQDIQYQVDYQRGKCNQADYMSRRGKPLNTIPKEEQKETEDLNNLLYTLHTTPIMDKIGLKEIAEETKKDQILQKLSNIIKTGKSWIDKSEDTELKRFEQILPEITITGNGILLKGDRIILPSSLHRNTIALAHRGSHPQQSSMEHRLRAHFFS